MIYLENKYATSLDTWARQNANKTMSWKEVIKNKPKQWKTTQDIKTAQNKHEAA